MPAHVGSPLRSRYERHGFALVEQPILSAGLVSRARDGLRAVADGSYDTGLPPEPSPWTPGDDSRLLVKIELPHVASHVLREVVGHPAIGRLAAEVTGAERVQVWWVQGLIKPPTDGGAATTVGWHQDRSYWGAWESGSELLTAWVALDDVTAESGPVRYVIGSHGWGTVCASNFFRQDRDAQSEEIAPPGGLAWDECPAVLPAGAVALHERRTLHGSGPNTSDRPRPALALHLRTERARPVGDGRTGLVRYLDDPMRCPWIYGGVG